MPPVFFIGMVDIGMVDIGMEYTVYKLAYSRDKSKYNTLILESAVGDKGDRVVAYRLRYTIDGIEYIVPINDEIDLGYDEKIKVDSDIKTEIQKNREYLNLIKQRAQILATKAHFGQKDRGGNPYIKHPEKVSSMAYDLEASVVGLLHDVLEDSDLTEQDLLDCGLPYPLLDAVLKITKSKQHYDKSKYIDGLCSNLTATLVKCADLTHNSDISRLKKVTQKDINRTASYYDMLNKLRNDLSHKYEVDTIHKYLSLLV